MRNTFRTLFYINRQKIRKDGCVPILCRITIDGCSVSISTKLNCSPESWDVQTGSSPEVALDLKKYEARIKEAHQTILEQEGYITPQLIKDYLSREREIAKPQLLSELSLLAIRSYEKRMGTQVSSSTYVYNMRRHNTLLQWLSQECAPRKLSILECRKAHFDAYKEWLLGRGLAPTTTRGYLSWFAGLMHKAVAMKLIKSSPFYGVKYPQVAKEEPRFLNRVQVSRLVELRSQLRGEERMVLDLFLLSCFTGMAFVDITRLNQTDIKEDAQGRRYIRKKRFKTNVEFIIPIGKMAWTLLQGRMGNAGGDKPFFSVSYHSVSQILRSLALICGIERLSFHMARHTFATLNIEAGVSTETLARMMGHRSLSSTQIYGRITEEKIAREMRQTMGKMTK